MPESTEPVLAELITLRQAVGLMTTNVAVLTAATDTLRQTIDRLQSDMVSRAEFEALEQRVAEHKAAAEKGIDRNDKRWAQVVTFICFAVLAALLGVVLGTGAIGTP